MQLIECYKLSPGMRGTYKMHTIRYFTIFVVFTKKVQPEFCLLLYNPKKPNFENSGLSSIPFHFYLFIYKKYIIISQRNYIK